MTIEEIKASLKCYQDELRYQLTPHSNLVSADCHAERLKDDLVYILLAQKGGHR